jgi:hypothetical protein
MLLTLLPAAGADRASALEVCNAAKFVADVTIPDGTYIDPGKTYTKTWRIQNAGTCRWTTSYGIVFASGEKMGGPDLIAFATPVYPGQTVDISVPLVAPTAAGIYRGYWQLTNGSSTFGIGSAFNKQFWVEIRVLAPSQLVTGFDFTTDICSAQWTYDGGPIPCPLNPNKRQYGLVQRLDNPTLENGLPGGAPGLLTIPQSKFNGLIRGAFDITDIFRGDHFQALVGCEYGAYNCYVTYMLEYLSPAGEFSTIWKFREKYDGLYYKADVDLSGFAGRKGRLVLTVLASGPFEGDRPLWVAPRIVRSVSAPSVTPIPPTTVPPPGSTVTPVPPPTSGCDRAQFISDVSVPDGTIFQPNAAFTKTWRLKNSGTCTWTTAYSLVFVSGDKMSGIDSVLIPQTVVPGQTVDLGLNLAAPSLAGSYRGYWQLKNAGGALFGIGTNADRPFYVDIKVVGSTSVTPAFDFVSNVCSAQWSSPVGSLPCPGTDGDARGFVLSVGAPRLETGATDPRPGLITFPQNAFDGSIQGIYPVFRVQSGDRFQATVNCEFGASDCFVLFRLDYQIGGGSVQSFWSIAERYDGLYYPVDIDLSSLAGQDVKFILTVLANGSANGDRAVWVAPRIMRSGASVGGGADLAVPLDTPVVATP